jgi:2-octaprenyl-6-methoxyphenol hydroxylase
VWNALSLVAGALTPIARIDISQAGGFGQTRSTRAEHGLPALGYVVSYRALQAALDAALARSTRGDASRRHRDGGAQRRRARWRSRSPANEREHLAGALRRWPTARGMRWRSPRGSATTTGKSRSWPSSFLAAPHDGTRVRAFYAGGPMALLPEHDGYGLVWTATARRAQELLALSDDDSCSSLRAISAHGRAVSRASPTAARFRSSWNMPAEPARARCVALGNAAQTLHPVAGKASTSACATRGSSRRIVLDTPREKIGADEMLARYSRSRRTDRMAGIAFTHGLVRLFGNDLPLLRWPRGLALTLLDAVPMAKRAFTRAMLFGVR